MLATKLALEISVQILALERVVVTRSVEWSTTVRFVRATVDTLEILSFNANSNANPLSTKNLSTLVSQHLAAPTRNVAIKIILQSVHVCHHMLAELQIVVPNVLSTQTAHQIWLA